MVGIESMILILRIALFFFFYSLLFRLSFDRIFLFYWEKTFEFHGGENFIRILQNSSIENA